MLLSLNYIEKILLCFKNYIAHMRLSLNWALSVLPFLGASLRHCGQSAAPCDVARFRHEPLGKCSHEPLDIRIYANVRGLERSREVQAVERGEAAQRHVRLSRRKRA